MTKTRSVAHAKELVRSDKAPLDRHAIGRSGKGKILTYYPSIRDESGQTSDVFWEILRLSPQNCMITTLATPSNMTFLFRLNSERHHDPDAPGIIINWNFTLTDQFFQF